MPASSIARPTSINRLSDGAAATCNTTSSPAGGGDSAALEALAIIAYQQPVTRPQVDAIRGVNSDGVMKNLLHKGLIQEVGRAEGPGRPILYSTTPEFLGHFGLGSLEELPPLNLEDLNAVKDVSEEASNNLLKD